MRLVARALVAATGAMAITWAAILPVHATSLLGQDANGGIPIQVGGIVVAAPVYEGAKRYQVIGAPFVFPAGLGGGGDGMVQVKGMDDVRLRLLRWQGLEAGPLAGFRKGRDDDQRRLHGLGDVDGGLVAGGYVGYRLGSVMPFVSYHHQVTGDDTGGILRFGVEATAKPTPWLSLTGVAGANWMSNDYAQSYFTVTGLQSRRSGLAVYDADAGIKDVFAGLTGDIALDRNWSLKLIGRYSHLTDEAAGSSIVETESQLFGGIGLTYKFTIGGR